MAFEKKQSEFDNTDRGVLFKNKDKDKETDRDYGGSLNVGGADYWLSAWLKTSKKGEKFLSLSIKPKNKLVGGGRKPGDMNDAIPFEPERR